MTVDISRHNSVAVITWRDGENRINLESLAELHAALDEVQAIEGPLSVVFTAEGKFFSNGLDLEKLGTEGPALEAMFVELDRLCGRLLTFPAYTIGAINGHAFAGGAILSMTFDHRIMRTERGFWCLNEAEIGFPLTENLSKVILARLPRPLALRAMLTADRWNADGAVAAGLVEQMVPEEELLSAAIAWGEHMATRSRAVITEHKRLVYGELAASLGA